MEQPTYNLSIVTESGANYSMQRYGLEDILRTVSLYAKRAHDGNPAASIVINLIPQEKHEIAVRECLHLDTEEDLGVLRQSRAHLLAAGAKA